MTTETQAALVQRLRKRRYSAVPDPKADLQVLYNAVLALKENVELLIGERSVPYVADTKAVTWGDLLALGLIEEGQLPPTRGRE